MKILIIIGNSLLGTALGELLEREPEGYRTRVAQDLDDLDRFRPDFVIMDCYTLRAAAILPLPETKTVLIDYGLSEDEITSLLLTGKIDGVIATTCDLPLLKKALRSILEGQIWIDNGKVKALIRHAESTMATNQHTGFSKKEREIVILVSRGFRNREIAEQLCISEQTVKTHISRIFRKMNVSRRSQLVPLALKLTLPDTP